MTSTEPRPNKSITIVSITPLKVQADSRTFKQAASVARFGYTSIVVEGQRSNFAEQELPFELRTVGWCDSTAGGSRPEKSQPEGSSDSETETPVATSIKQNRVLKSPPLVRSDENKLVCFLRSSYRRLVPESIRLLLRHPLRWIFLILFFLRRLPLIIKWRLIMVAERLKIVDLIFFVRYVSDFLYKYGYLPLKCTPKASLYYLHAFYQFPAVYLLCLRYRARYIYDAHDFYSQIGHFQDPSSLQVHWIKPFEQWIERLCIKKAAALVTVSDGVAQLYKDYCDSEAVVVRNVQDIRFNCKHNLHLRKRLHLSSDEFLIVCVGNAKPGMAVAELYEAMINLPTDVHIAFLGGGYEPYITMAQAKGLEQRVHFVPPVAPNEVIPFIQSADAAIVIYYSMSVNYQNCLPNGFFQPISAQLPLFYPELSEIKKIVEHYNIGIPIDPQSPPSITKGVITLLNNKELMFTFRQHLILAQQELNWEREEKILFDLFSQILNN